MSLMLNLGCGNAKLPGFVNVDVRMGVSPDVVADLNHPLPFNPGSVDRIVSYHALEHMTETAGDALLQSIYQLLRNGGGLYMEMPEFDRIVRNYLRNHTPMSKHRIFGLGRDEYDYHRWGYNYIELAERLVEIGFTGVQRMKAKDHHAVNNMCFGIEAWK